MRTHMGTHGHRLVCPFLQVTNQRRLHRQAWKVMLYRRIAPTPLWEEEVVWVARGRGLEARHWLGLEAGSSMVGRSCNHSGQHLLLLLAAAAEEVAWLPPGCCRGLGARHWLGLEAGSSMTDLSCKPVQPLLRVLHRHPHLYHQHLRLLSRHIPSCTTPCSCPFKKYEAIQCTHRGARLHLHPSIPCNHPSIPCKRMEQQDTCQHHLRISHQQERCTWSTLSPCHRSTLSPCNRLPRTLLQRPPLRATRQQHRYRSTRRQYLQEAQGRRRRHLSPSRCRRKSLRQTQKR